MTQSLSPEDLNRNTLHRRGVEAAIWGMPVVNFDRMFQAMTSAHGGWNQILYWSRPSTSKNQLLTPNPDALYALPFSAAAHLPDTTFVPADDILIDATIPYNQTFFESLNRVVQYEPWLDRDRAMIDQLKSIGIQQASLSRPIPPPAPSSGPLSTKPTPGSSISTKPHTQSSTLVSTGSLQVPKSS